MLGGRELIAEADFDSRDVPLCKCHNKCCQDAFTVVFAFSSEAKKGEGQMALTWPLEQQGSTGEDVKTVQYLVTAQGHATGVDGIFGPLTKSAVEAFQSSRGLGVDGIVAGRHVALGGVALGLQRTGAGLEVRGGAAGGVVGRQLQARAVRLAHVAHHRVHAAHLRAAHQGVLFSDPPEIVALELRSALEQLGAMTGAIYTDDLLDRVFSRFCVGK